MSVEEQSNRTGLVPRKRQENVWVVSELYYPEQSATGYFLTNIAEGLARVFPVRAIAAQPTYQSRGMKAPTEEVRNGVKIHRTFSTTFDKDVVLKRFLNLVTFSVSVFVRGLMEFSPRDIVIVVTNPPTLPYSVLLACKLRNVRCWLLVHDVYPDVLVAAGMIRKNGLVCRILSWCNTLLYSGMNHIIVLGRDMKELVRGVKPSHEAKISIVHNWGDIERVMPDEKDNNVLLKELGIENKFVVQYSGNMGRTHGLECIVEAAKALTKDSGIHFVFIGSGAKKAWLEEQVTDIALANVTVLPPQPRETLGMSLNACDIAVVTFMPGMAGVSVPSRMYNILAAGKPIIAVADSHSELALVVLEERIGWLVPPGDSKGLIQAIREASTHSSLLREMGLRARKAAEAKYSKQQIMHSYHELVASMYGQEG